jgi:hypothetical protein
MIAQDAVDNRKDLGLIAVDDFTESELVMGLDAPDKICLFAVLVVHSGPGSGPFARCRERNGFQ